MTTTITVTVITTDVIARNLRLRPEAVEEMLHESERQGVVEQVGEGWKLSAEVRFGSALREITGAVSEAFTARATA